MDLSVSRREKNHKWPHGRVMQHGSWPKAKCSELLSTFPHNIIKSVCCPVPQLFCRLIFSLWAGRPQTFPGLILNPRSSPIWNSLSSFEVSLLLPSGLLSTSRATTSHQILPGISSSSLLWVLTWSPTLSLSCLHYFFSSLSHPALGSSYPLPADNPQFMSFCWTLPELQKPICSVYWIFAFKSLTRG